MEISVRENKSNSKQLRAKEGTCNAMSSSNISKGSEEINSAKKAILELVPVQQ